MLYTLRFFSSKCSLFHNANLFGSYIIHILYTGVLKLKKNDSGAKGIKRVKTYLILECRVSVGTFVAVKQQLLLSSERRTKIDSIIWG